MVGLTDDDEMIAAIMLHEIGHVIERHSMQSVVRQAGISALIFAVTGDVNSAATTLLILLPSVLIQSTYSRQLEYEADSYALAQMQDRAIDPEKFADMMERLVASLDEASETEDDDAEAIKKNEQEEVNQIQEDPERSVQASLLEQYFSSHPASSDRIERFRSASRNSTPN